MWHIFIVALTFLSTNIVFSEILTQTIEFTNESLSHAETQLTNRQGRCKIFSKAITEIPC